MRITVVIDVDKPMGQAIGIKEAVAMLLEQWGDTRVISVTESKETVEQLKIGGGR